MDTSAIIYLNDFRIFEELYTVSDVIDEIKDKVNALKISGMNIRILEPRESSIKEIKRIAQDTGDLEKLSKTDIKILALAKEKELSIISDDYSIQNVAQKIGINYVSLFNKKISKTVKWRKYCNNCRSFFEKIVKCPKCGGVLTRRRVTEEFIRQYA